MVVLVTGGAGYIGSHLVLAGQSRGEAMVILDDLSTGQSRLVPADVPLVVGDVGNTELVKEIIRKYQVHAIIHFAAKTSVPNSIRQPLHYYQENACKAFSLIETAAREGVGQFVFSSSAAVYGACPGGIADENTPPAPLSPYGRSKLMTEWALADAASAFGMRSVVLRYFNVAGADPEERAGRAASESTHLIHCAVQAALGQLPGLTVHGVDYPTADGTCVRDFIHVSDLARAHLAALDYLRAGGETVTLNCGNGRGASVLDVVKAVQQVSGRDFPVTYGPRRAGDPPNLVAATGRLRSLLDWQPEYSELTEIIAHSLAWERRLAAL